MRYTVTVRPPAGTLAGPTTVMDINPDITQLSWTTVIPGGFGAADVGMRDPRAPQWGYLPIAPDIDGFYDVRIKAGSFTCFEGRVMGRKRIAGAVRGFTAEGYGLTATKDSVFYGVPAGTSSGQVLLSILGIAAPLLAVPNRDNWEDPGVSAASADYDGMLPSQVIEAVSKLGGGQENAPFDFSVWENAAAQLIGRISPTVPDYVIDADDDLEIDDDFHDLCSGVIAEYTSAGSTNRTTEVLNQLTIDRYRIERDVLLKAGEMDSASALQVARAYLAYNSGPQSPITLHLPAGKGLRRPNGGAEAPGHLIRAGQWLQVGKDDPCMILSTEFSANTEELSINAKHYPREFFDVLNDVERIAANFLFQTSAVSGAKL